MSDRYIKRGPAYYRRPQAEPWTWTWVDALRDGLRLFRDVLVLLLCFGSILLWGAIAIATEGAK